MEVDGHLDKLTRNKPSTNSVTGDLHKIWVDRGCTELNSKYRCVKVLKVDFFGSLFPSSEDFKSSVHNEFFRVHQQHQ